MMLLSFLTHEVFYILALNRKCMSCILMDVQLLSLWKWCAGPLFWGDHIRILFNKNLSPELVIYFAYSSVVLMTEVGR